VTRATVIVLGSILASATAHADAGDAGGAGLHARIGSVRAPFYSAAHPLVRSDLQAYALVLDGWARLRGQWSLGARFPIATSSVEEPAGSYAADYTLGNPLLYAEHDRAMRPDAVLRLRAGLGLPLAGAGDSPSLVRNRVLAASDALDGWRATELYQPGTVPIIVAATIDRVRPAWRARAGVKLATFVRITDASLPPGSDRHALAIIPSSEVSLAWHPRSWLSAGLGLHATLLALPTTTPIRDVGRSGRLHAGTTPSLSVTRGRATFTLDFLLALAGPLDGTAGLGAHIAWRQ
jgi:hypothetical protein